LLDPKTSKRIFELAKDQQEEMEIPEHHTPDSEQDEKAMFSKPRSQALESEDEDEDISVSDGDAEVDEETFVRTLPFIVKVL
jgi:essential nuclear protein 1